MKESIAFIAVGQAAGNIGRLFEKEGFNVLFINTSIEDLNTLTDVKFKYHIPEGEGCNKDRDKAKNLVIDHFDEIVSEIKSKIKEEFIYVIFSTGGGTGSGAAPMLIDLLSMNLEDNTIGAITILPSDKESLRTHINAYESIKELVDIENIGGTYLIDNNNGNKIEINKVFVELFKRMLKMITYIDERGNIDKAELKEMLRTKGVNAIGNVSKNNTNTSTVLLSLKETIFAPFTDKVIKYIGFVGPETIDIDDIGKEVGTNYVDVFRGYTDKEATCLLCGMKFPEKRIEAIKKRIDSSKEQVIEDLKSVEVNNFKGDVNFLNGFKSKKVVEKATEKDIFAKYRKI
jgi:hypothetical protein